MENFIFFDDARDADQSVYRIFNIQRLLQVFEYRKLALVKPKKWDDPFENFILKSKATLETGEDVTFSFSDMMFGQCWSQHKETDAMWRIYSHDKDGVKVRTTPRKLHSALSAQVANPAVSAFIGKVKYETQTTLTSMVTDRVRMHNKIFDPTGKGHAETLLFKRREFSHEKEVRLIFSGGREHATNDVFTFEIDPFNLIEEVVFDPRMDENLTSIYIAHLKNIGFTGRLSKSGLYRLPKLVVSA